MSTRAARVMRGLVVACVSLLVATAAHLSGGGQIGEVGFVLAAIFSVFVSIGLTGRSVSRLRIAVSVVLSQGAFHLLFGIGAGYRSPAMSSTSGMGMTGMGKVPVVAPVITPMTHAATMPDNGWMWMAHGLAALITIMALVRGEKTFWELTEQVTLALTRVFSPVEPVSVPRRQVPSVVIGAPEPSARFLVAGLRHRGPPQALASS